MNNRLSLPYLLNQLDVSHNNDTVDSLCREAEALRTQRRYKKAIEVAEHALHIAHQTPNPDEAKTAPNYNYNSLPQTHNAVGVTLLYLSLARLSSNLPGEEQRAAHDCQHAITRFKLDPHNYAIAQMFKAQIEQQVENPQQSLIHLHEAVDTLEKLIKERLAHGRLEDADQYQDLRSKVKVIITEISRGLVEVEQIKVSQKQHQPEQSQETKPRPERSAPSSPPGLHVPTELLWPVLDPIEVVSITHNRDLEANGKSQDYIEVDQLFINGKPYAVQVVDSAANKPGLLKLRPNQQYVPIRVKSNGDNDHVDKYVLVRRTSRPSHRKDIVAAMHPSHELVWAEWNPVPGDIADKRGEREWIFLDLSEDDIGEVRIIGIVEAVLTPMTPTSTREQVQELLDCLNDLRIAENAQGVDPQTAKGLAGIREKLKKHLVTYHGLEPIPIIAGETEFDVKQGHTGIGVESHDDLPKNIIVKVIQDGFRQQGKVIQEAKVIVNR